MSKKVPPPVNRKSRRGLPKPKGKGSKEVKKKRSPTLPKISNRTPPVVRKAVIPTNTSPENKKKTPPIIAKRSGRKPLPPTAKKVEEDLLKKKLAEEKVKKEAEIERKRIEDEKKKKKLAEEKRLKEAEEAKRKAEERALAKKKAEEEAEKRRKEAEEARRLAEETKRKAEEEEEAKRKAEEAERIRIEAEEAEKNRLEEAKRMEEEQKRAEEEARRAKEEAEARRLAEEAKRKAEEELQAKIKAEQEAEALRKQKEEEEKALAKQKAEEEALKQQQEQEEALKKQKEEEEALKKQKEEEEAHKKKQAEEEEALKKQKEEEEKRKQSESEQKKIREETKKKKISFVTSFRKLEKNFHTNLSTLKSYGPELEKKKLLKKPVLDKMFAPITKILFGSKKFLGKLQKGYDEKTFSKSVKEMSVCFGEYLKFAGVCELNLNTLRKEKFKVSKLNSYLKKKESALKKKKMKITTFTQFYTLPFKHISTYLTFFNNLNTENSKILEKNEIEIEEENEILDGIEVINNILKKSEEGKQKAIGKMEMEMIDYYVDIVDFLTPKRDCILVQKSLQFRNLTEKKFGPPVNCVAYVLTDLLVIFAYDKETEKKKKNLLIKTYVSYLRGMTSEKKSFGSLNCIVATSLEDSSFKAELVFNKEETREDFYTKMMFQIDMVDFDQEYMRDGKVKRKVDKKKKLVKKGMRKDWIICDHIPPSFVNSKNLDSIVEYNAAPLKKRKKLGLKLDPKFWK